MPQVTRAALVGLLSHVIDLGLCLIPLLHLVIAYVMASSLGQEFLNQKHPWQVVWINHQIELTGIGLYILTYLLLAIASAFLVAALKCHLRPAHMLLSVRAAIAMHCLSLLTGIAAFALLLPMHGSCMQSEPTTCLSVATEDPYFSALLWLGAYGPGVSLYNAISRSSPNFANINRDSEAQDKLMDDYSH